MERINLLLDYLDLLLDCKYMDLNFPGVYVGTEQVIKELNQYFFEQQKTAKADCF